MSTTPAGWYPDPEREGATRWWDGQQWAPSQDAAAATDDRFKPRDGSSEADAAAATDSWSPTPYDGPGTAWEQQDASSSQWSQQQSAPAWGAASTPAASAPAADASATSEPSWQASTPSWTPQEATPTYGQPSYGQSQPQHGAPQDYDQTGAQPWNQYGAAQPKKSRTGLFVGIGAGVLVLLLLLVGGGIFLATNLLGNVTQVQTQGGGSQGGGTQTGGDSFTVSVAPNGQSRTDIEITTAGMYQIDVISTNSEDPRIELTGNGQSWSDDDGGDEPLASRLEEYLEVGTYTLMVEEYSGDQLEAVVTVAQR